ncbi:hypothetical protein [Congregicoccus parvus]|uniref:hypothetical protein n=1 Tax=Congregicoccus parvus TaxID=3081749 RepID=UPI003FA5E8BB
MHTYTHSSGLSVRHPADWTVREDGFSVLLLPPDPARDAQGQPLELLLFGTQDAEGVTSPADPAVGDYFAGELARVVPGIQRSGTPRTVACDLGAAAAFDYVGADSTGLAVRAAESASPTPRGSASSSAPTAGSCSSSRRAPSETAPT